MRLKEEFGDALAIDRGENSLRRENRARSAPDWPRAGNDQVPWRWRPLDRPRKRAHSPADCPRRFARDRYSSSFRYQETAPRKSRACIASAPRVGIGGGSAGNQAGSRFKRGLGARIFFERSLRHALRPIDRRFERLESSACDAAWMAGCAPSVSVNLANPLKPRCAEVRSERYRALVLTAPPRLRWRRNSRTKKSAPRDRSSARPDSSRQEARRRRQRSGSSYASTHFRARARSAGARRALQSTHGRNSPACSRYAFRIASARSTSVCGDPVISSLRI